jgi:hypothetical protein
VLGGLESAVKCGQYWPELEGSNVTYGMYNILSENIENYEDFMDFMDFRKPFRKPRIGTKEKGKLKLTRIVQGKELFHLLSILVKENIFVSTTRENIFISSNRDQAES